MWVNDSKRAAQGSIDHEPGGIHELFVLISSLIRLYIALIPGKTIRFSGVGKLVIGISQSDLGGVVVRALMCAIRYVRVVGITLALQASD